MNVAERREEILKVLREAAEPVPAKEFAARFGVSRQVIVQDFAVIRASVPGIVSTYRGYVLQQERKHTREFKVCHTDEDASRELNLIVDYGGHVKNVSISHRVYGRVSVEMDIASRQDVREFTEALATAKSTLLSKATSGYHYHLVEAASEQRLDRIEEQLAGAGILAPLSPWEQTRKDERITGPCSSHI
ncbi:MAG: transcription repressor NadR [Clostridiales bacterium]|nr:transcription repressor NadR [Clostridiales bacterium]